MISLYITNKAGSGNSVSTLGNSVTINLNQPILLDEKKKYNMRLLQANIVYCSPNVYTNVNNVLSYSYNNVAKTITFDQGLYSIEDINYKIQVSTKADFNDEKLFYFNPDTSTSKIYVVYNQGNIVINCSAQYSIMPLLGFPSSTGNIGGSSKYTLSTNQADLNSLQSIYIKCDCVTGSYEGSRVSNVLASVIPDTAPFGTIQYRPYFPTRNEITSRRLDQITISLTDQDGKDIDMNTNNGAQLPEAWGVLLTIEAEELKLSHNQN